jgi:tRNA(His) 5'-end guanylyltransferase
MKTNETADALAARVKHFEDVSAKTVLDENLPICVRLDGKAFHSFTKGLDKPFDERFSKAMISTMNYLLEKTNAQVAYTQSDEISLVYFKAADYQQAYFGAREQKLASVLASMATAKFNQEVFKNIPEKAETLAFFDCRVWNVPSLDDAADVFKWRQLDAVKNSISVAAHTNFSNQETLRKSSKEKIAMLATIGIDWHGYPEAFKSGTYATRKLLELPLPETAPPIEGRNSCLRSVIENTYFPKIHRKENLSAFLFDEIFENHKRSVEDKKANKKLKPV